MPLYNSKRDAGFLLGVNKEIMHRISSVEVAIYKLNLEITKTNIYEETENRTYLPPIRIHSQVQIDSTSVDSQEIVDREKTALFGFLEHDLINADVILREGDIIYYDNIYYEVDRVSGDNYWSGRNPNSSIAVKEDNQRIHGYRVSIIAECHMTRMSSLHISDVRTGNNPNSTKENSSIPKFL